MGFIPHWSFGRPGAGKAERAGGGFIRATGERIAQVAFASPSDVDTAVASAKAASVTWRQSSLAKQEPAFFFAFRELVEKHKRTTSRAAVDAQNTEKVLSDARSARVTRGLFEVIEFACGIPELLKGEFSENVSTEVDSYSIRQPLGVVAGITPFNFPAMVPMWMYPIAIACGNTFVLKPSEKDPSATNFCADLFAKAGLPEGVLNVVHGDKVAVDRLLEHPDVQAVSFVGSTPIAKYIFETGSRHGKRVQALGGAKNHMIVLPDADMELAADSVVGAAYGSAGERCMAISRYPGRGWERPRTKLLPKVLERIAKLKVGNGVDQAAEKWGPLVHARASRASARLRRQGCKRGREASGGRANAQGAGMREGFFHRAVPVRQRDAGHEDPIKTRSFGPVLSTVRMDSYDDAIRLVNENRYANGVAIFTNDGGAARKFQAEIQVGMVGVNVPIPVPLAYYSFGGWKQSLFGDTHIYGRDGVRFCTRGKVVISRWPDPRHRGVDLGFPQSR